MNSPIPNVFTQGLFARSRKLLYALMFSVLLGACGGGGGQTPISDTTVPVAKASCDPEDATTSDECGVLYLAITDADGDFLSYTVDVLSLSLERADGTSVETLPNNARIDFADYVELSEFASARLLPPGNYVAGTLTLDYGNAEILVEKDGQAAAAVALDSNGTSLGVVEVRIEFVKDDPVRLTRRAISFLMVDFDLAASHTVDLSADPIVVTAEPVIVADIEPVEEKTLRARGPLQSVDTESSSYEIRLRPFHRRDGNNGSATITIDENTQFGVNGVEFTGSDGLNAMASLDQGTATRALGILNLSTKTYLATEVLVGSSVPGIDRDFVRGHIVSRNGDRLEVLGASIIPRDRVAHFNETISIIIGPETRVFKSGQRGTMLGNDALSVGQRVMFSGELNSSDPDNLVLDASTGVARLYATRLSGFVTQAVDGQVDMDLRAIGRRRPALFDFSGTGSSAETDADPNNYEVATQTLPIDGLAVGSPIRAFGFVNDFGFAPPDFNGRTLIDYASLKASLGIGWTAEGSSAPFLSINPDSIVPDPAAFADDARHAIKIGARLIELTEIDGGISIAGSDADRTLYGIRGAGSVQLFRNFTEFSDALASALDGSTKARSMHAHGKYNVDTKTFSAQTMWVILLNE